MLTLNSVVLKHNGQPVTAADLVVGFDYEVNLQTGELVDRQSAFCLERDRLLVTLPDGLTRTTSPDPRGDVLGRKIAGCSDGRRDAIPAVQSGDAAGAGTGAAEAEIHPQADG